MPTWNATTERTRNSHSIRPRNIENDPRTNVNAAQDANMSSTAMKTLGLASTRNPCRMKADSMPAKVRCHKSVYGNAV